MPSWCVSSKLWVCEFTLITNWEVSSLFETNRNFYKKFSTSTTIFALGTVLFMFILLWTIIPFIVVVSMVTYLGRGSGRWAENLSEEVCAKCCSRGGIPKWWSSVSFFFSTWWAIVFCLDSTCHSREQNSIIVMEVLTFFFCCDRSSFYRCAKDGSER